VAEPDNSLMVTILRELRSDFRKQQDLMSGLAANQRRIIETMDRRFEHADQQLKAVADATERRFEHMDQQLKATTDATERRFDHANQQLKAAVDSVDRRFSNIEHQIRDLVPDLELMLKSEMMGRLTNFETRIEERIAELESRK
jgi:exonuclease VII large subunit